MPRPIATGLAAAHFAAAVSRMVAVWLLVPPSSGAGDEQEPMRHQYGSAHRYLGCTLAD
jgi:hypothetical protein